MCVQAHDVGVTVVGCWVTVEERLVCMVNYKIEELLGLDMEPQPESLWRRVLIKRRDSATAEGGE